jgi:hypothetical protein
VTVEIAILVIASFPFFWFHSFDPTLRVRVYKQWAPQAPEGTAYDAIPRPISWSGAGACVWTLLLGALAAFGAGYCSIRSENPFSIQSAVGVLAVAITSKIVFGPSYSSFKSIMLTNEGRRARLLLFDYLTVYPVNFLNAVIAKFFWFILFWVVLWLASKVVGFDLNKSTLALPTFVCAAMLWSYVGRIMTFYTNLNARAEMFPWVSWSGHAQLAMIIILLVSWFTTYILLEAALKNCGAQVNLLPTYHQLIAGVALVPLIEGAIALLF